jgi:hypothetical protein
MLRAGINIWVATGACVSIIVFGGGVENLAWGFQIAFVGSLFFALAQLALVDHDGRLSWRDGLGVLAGLSALMCSNIGVPLVLIVGVFLAIKRRWLAALVATVPLGCLFLGWYVWFGRAAAGINKATRAQLADIPHFIWRGITAALDGTTQLAGIAPVLLVVLICAVIVARRSFRDLAIPTAALAGIGIFYAAISYGRVSFGVDQAVASRYVYVGGALAIIAIAFALNALQLSRSRKLLIVGLAVGWMFFANCAAFYGSVIPIVDQRMTLREEILAVPQLPGIERVDPSLRPSPKFNPNITVGGLLALARAGDLPASGPIPPNTWLTAAVRALVTVGPVGTSALDGQASARDAATGAPVVPIAGCASIASSIVVTPASAISVTLPQEGQVEVQLVQAADRAESEKRKVSAMPGQPVVIASRFPDAELEIRPPLDQTVLVCGLR